MPQERFVTVRHHVEIPRVLLFIICLTLLVLSVKSIAELWMMQSMQDQVTAALTGIRGAGTPPPAGSGVPGYR